MLKEMYLKCFVFASCFSTISTQVPNEEYNSMPPIFHFDDFEKCLLSNASNIYCTATIQIRLESSKNTSQIWDIIQEVNTQPYTYRHDLLRHGICLRKMSSTCNQSVENRLNYLYETKYKEMGLTGEVVEMKCETEKSEYEWQQSDLTVGAGLVTYVLLVLMATFGLHYGRKAAPERYNELLKTNVGQFLESFSIVKNFKLITTTNMKQSNADFLNEVQGLRFLATFGVLIAHETIQNFAAPLYNPQFIEKIGGSFTGTFDGHGSVLVQTFFVLSSFFLHVHLLNKLDKQGKVSFGYVALYILNRYLKLVPLVALMVALHSTLLNHVSRGPFWDLFVGGEYRRCRKNWWLNLLFVNNIFVSDGMCLVHTWYLAADFQLFVLFSLVVWLIQKKIYLLKYVSILLNLAHILALFVILFVNNWEIFIVFDGKSVYNFEVLESPEFIQLWFSTYSNISGYTVGSLLAYIYWKTKNQKLVPDDYRGVLLLILAFFLTIGQIGIYSLYIASDLHKQNRWLSSTYGSLTKTIFALGVSLSIFVVSQKSGGLLKKFVGYPFFRVMANLSFGVYVIHWSVILIKIGSRMFPPYLTLSSIILEALFDLVICSLISLLVTLLVVAPFANFFKKVLFLYSGNEISFR